MSKASKILITIGVVLSFIGAVLYLIFGLICLGLSSDAAKEAFIKSFTETPTSSIPGATPAEQAQFMVNCMSVCGTVFMIEIVASIANAVIGIIANKKQTKVLYILSIVFGVLSGILFNLIGGILGLVAVCTGKNNTEAIEE